MNDWIIYGIIAATPFVLIWLLNLKTSRPDGTFVKNLHKYRQVMFYIMPTRNESVVYFDEFIDAEKLLDYRDKCAEKFGTDVDITHITVAACARGFAENPRMNQFVSGYRLYKRKGIWLSFSMKREAMNKKAKLAVVKQEIREGLTFREMCEEVNAKINVERSGKKTYADKEYDIFTLLPRPVFYRTFKLVRQLNYWNLLPNSFIEPDPMHTSMFIANLGSLKMRPGYHHLYEWGTCPLFMMVGKIEDQPVVRDGEVVIRPMMQVRFSYDERIDDGLTASHGIQTMKEALEAPEAILGCLEDDGSDAYALATPVDER